MVDYVTGLFTLLGVFIGIGGSILVQRLFFKREDAKERRDKIYGPILTEISGILENTRQFEYSDFMSIQRLKGITRDYLFLTYADQDLKSGLSKLVNRIGIYEGFKSAARQIYGDIIPEEAKKTLGIDIGSGAYNIFLQLSVGKAVVSTILLHQAVFTNLNLKDFVETERKNYGIDMTVEAYIGGFKRSLDDFELLYTHVSQKLERDSFCLEERKQRERLIADIEGFLEKLKGFVKS